MTTPATERPEDRNGDVDPHNTAFRRELGLIDLILIQILYVVGSGWVGTAALLGADHVWYWLAAAALFYLPQAAVVIYLNRLMPLEGGIYQWAKVGLGRFLGFLVAWNLWAYAVLIMATFGVMVAQNLSYLIGSPGKWLTDRSEYTAIVSVVVIVAATLVSIWGLRVSKWVQNAGGAAQFFTYAALIAIPFVAAWRGLPTNYHPLQLPWHSLDNITLATLFSFQSLLTLNIFGKLALGAFSGFEYVAILAGECKSPARSIGRSVMIAVPIIALMFILGTDSVLALVPPGQIDLVSPIPQTLTLGFDGLGIVAWIAPMLIMLLLVRQIGNVMLLFAGTTRLPMVAGWDGLLPRWFTRLHPRFRTPINSVIFVGALTLVLTLAGQSGVHVPEAFQLLENAAGIFYAFTYLGLFAIPLFAGARLGKRPPLWLRAAAVAGFAVTLLYAVLSVYPIIEVDNPLVFSLKIIGVLVIANLVGVAIYAVERRRHTLAIKAPSDVDTRITRL